VLGIFRIGACVLEIGNRGFQQANGVDAMAVAGAHRRF
jgi:hypothetical protein